MAYWTGRFESKGCLFFFSKLIKFLVHKISFFELIKIVLYKTKPGEKINLYNPFLYSVKIKINLFILFWKSINIL